MFSAFIDPAHTVLAIERALSIPGTSLYTLILPNGRVFSCQPGGVPGDRDPGVDGPWERCRIAGGLATFHVDHQYYTFSFVIVAELE